jgi:arylsulfatase A
MKNNFIPLIAVLCLFGCKKNDETLYHSANAASPATAAGGPNIILIVADDVGFEVPRCNGGESYQTPNLDAMANAGIRFTNCHGAPECSPSRFMILTGKYNFRNYEKWGYMNPSEKTIGNMFRDAGYATCYAGKWQLMGAEGSILSLGFDAYSVWNPDKRRNAGSRYKSPVIYQGGTYLPDSVTYNKYADDWFTDYIFGFMDTVSKPFFVYYSMSLAHSPFSPTPLDEAFTSWQPDGKSDPVFFPSMIQYMDKVIGEIMTRVDNNTVVIFVGDNGSAKEITSVWDGRSIQGGKSTTTIYGTHVPLIVYRKGSSGYTDSSLVDFTDFLPTLASTANIPLPAYGTLDGTPFYPQKSTRQWIFCHYEPYPGTKDGALMRWVQDGTYKRYDTWGTDKTKLDKFYNIASDPYELHPIPARKRSTRERSVNNTFKEVLQSMQ